MAKKVAQLTKVIYLLNTKNDEHEYEMQLLEVQCESDVTMILQDASSRLETLKSSYEMKKNEDLSNAAGGNQAMLKQLEEMRRQHEVEKRHALGKLEKLKDQASQNETNLRNMTKDRIEAMKKEVEEAKTQVRQHTRRHKTKSENAICIYSCCSLNRPARCPTLPFPHLS